MSKTSLECFKLYNFLIYVQLNFAFSNIKIESTKLRGQKMTGTLYFYYFF